MCLSRVNKYIVPDGEIETMERTTADGKTITLFKSYSILKWAYNYFVLWEMTRDALRTQFGFYPTTGFIRSSIHQITQGYYETKQLSELRLNMTDLFMFHKHVVSFDDLRSNGYGYFVLNSINKRRNTIQHEIVPSLRCAMKSFGDSLKLRRTDAHEYKEKYNYDEDEARSMRALNKFPKLMKHLLSDKPELLNEFPRLLNETKRVKTHDTMRENIRTLVEELRNIAKLVFMDYVHLGFVTKDLEALLERGSTTNSLSKSLPLLMIPDDAMQKRMPDNRTRKWIVEADTTLYMDELNLVTLKGNLKEKVERQCPREKIFDYYFCAATTEAKEGL